MKKPKIENFAKNVTGAATNVKGNASANTPAFAKIENINLRNRNVAHPSGAGGLSGLVGSARRVGGTVGKVSNSASSEFGDSNVAAGEPTPGGELLFPGGRTLFEREIEAHPRFSIEVRAAWERSNPNGPKGKRREVGFFATVSGGDRPGVLFFRFSGYNEGKLGGHGIHLGTPPRPPGGSVVIDFHTHPFGINSAADDWDIQRIRRFPYATGVVYSFGGSYWYGREILG